MDYLVVDFEFTMKTFGNPRVWFPEIIEVGAVYLDRFGDSASSPYGTFVKPRFWPRITNECYGITGIHQKDIDNGIPIEQALHKLQSLSSSLDPCLVTWGNQDRKVLAKICEKYGLLYPFTYGNYLDLGIAYRDYANLRNMASLKSAIEATGVEMSGIQHAAMDDAVNTAAVMRKMILDGWKAEQVVVNKEYEKACEASGTRIQQAVVAI